MTSRLDFCNCFAVRQAARALTRDYERHLAATGLTSNQFSILVLIEEQPGIGMRQLSEDMVMDRTSVIRALKPLERDGLVAVRSSAADSRQNSYTLTLAGVTRVAEASPLWQAAQDEFVARFGGEDAAAAARKALLQMSEIE
ncbi:hypothetical protein GCM10009552_13000 [Rothia nasimurium]|uniref:Winged helix-turn-helix transcriptional regulator n=1 Tax=Luteibacter anthropi TaxID=564369 RepID=A0A7X5UD62_9GAMM|nr:MarR family winged helix-turn-helix transcriptional regulator [Luteibacter anthropi]NII08336.1 winged helix-turn-helix transcriptional regulator [Luteibacter anthropi]